MREVDYRTTENATHNLTKRDIKQYKEQRGEAPPERFEAPCQERMRRKRHAL